MMCPKCGSKSGAYDVESRAAVRDNDMLARLECDQSSPRAAWEADFFARRHNMATCPKCSANAALAAARKESERD